MAEITEPLNKNYTAFRGHRQLVTGNLSAVALRVKKVVDDGGGDAVLVFDDMTGTVMDLDLRGSVQQVKAWADAQLGKSNKDRSDQRLAARGRGRPKLGVVAREVTLLPRHWAWLAAQRGGASATLRRLVEDARKSGKVQDRVRKSQDAAYKFMSALAGDLPGYEEAIRALFAGNEPDFIANIESWPEDVTTHCRRLALPSFRTED